jgi:hypothetical protein
MLVNQASISDATKNKLGQYTNMIIVGKYNPTNLDYSKLTSLQNLRMYDGNMDDALRAAVQDLVKGTRVLRYLEVPKWGQTIIADAFKNASYIQQIIGFEDVTTVGDMAFSSCTGLTSLSFPKLTSAGYGAFADCSSLISLDLPSLISAGNTNVPGAFQGTGLKSVTLPKLTNLGYSTFCFCSELKDITLPDTINAVNPHSFRYMSITTLRLIGQNSLGNGIESSCAKIRGEDTYFTTTVTKFYFMIGDEVQKISNTGALYNYIQGVLGVTKTQFGLFANSTGTGTLDLGARFSNTGLSVNGTGYLIDTIIGSGTETIVH